MGGVPCSGIVVSCWRWYGCSAIGITSMAAVAVLGDCHTVAPVTWVYIPYRSSPLGGTWSMLTATQRRGSVFRLSSVSHACRWMPSRTPFQYAVPPLFGGVWCGLCICVGASFSLSVHQKPFGPSNGRHRFRSALSSRCGLQGFALFRFMFQPPSAPPPRPVNNVQELMRFHQADYVNFLEKVMPGPARGQGTGPQVSISSRARRAMWPDTRHLSRVPVRSRAFGGLGFEFRAMTKQ